MALIVHVRDAGCEKRQFGHIAVDQRQIVDEPAVDDLPSHRIFRRDRRTLRLNLDRLRGPSNLHREIGRRILADVQLDMRAYRLLKALHLRCHGVRPGRNRCEQIPAVAVGCGRELVSLLLVLKSDFGPLNHGA